MACLKLLQHLKRFLPMSGLEYFFYCLWFLLILCSHQQTFLEQNCETVTYIYTYMRNHWNQQLAIFQLSDTLWVKSLPNIHYFDELANQYWHYQRTGLKKTLNIIWHWTLSPMVPAYNIPHRLIFIKRQRYLEIFLVKNG